MYNFPKLSELTNKQDFVVRAKWPKFYEYLINNYPDYLCWSEKLYWYYYNIRELPKCKLCGQPVKYINFSKGYREYCSSKCSANDPVQKLNRVCTNLEKYGSSSPLSSDLIKEKIKQTNIERYGTENPMQNESIRDKAKSTNIERYGTENPFASDLIKEKIKQTNLDRYGTENPMQNESIRDKAKSTNIERYGTENPSLSLECNKKKSESLRKYHIKNMMYKENVIDYTSDGDWICKCPHSECDKCKEKCFTINSGNYYDRVRVGVELCTIINPIQNHMVNKNTSLELFVQSILDEVGIEYETNVKNIIPPLELDIYIPSKNIAIECNGIKWHSDKPSSYHLNKYLDCKKKGIHLITLWEDQIKLKPEIVRSIVLSKMGIYENRIYARKCIIKEIDTNICTEFLKNNHIQGKTNSNIKLGLYYNDALVSVMTFKKVNKYFGKHKSVDVWDLNRFCSLLNTQIVGGADRLLKYFISKYNPSNIISYSSNDISNGDLYKKLGFEPDDKYTVSYWYIHRNSKERYHRTSFTKSKLKEMGYNVENSTESEIMKQLNFYRIFDCGHRKYTLNI